MWLYCFDNSGQCLNPSRHWDSCLISKNTGNNILRQEIDGDIMKLQIGLIKKFTEILQLKVDLKTWWRSSKRRRNVFLFGSDILGTGKGSSKFQEFIFNIINRPNIHPHSFIVTFVCKQHFVAGSPIVQIVQTTV